MREKSEKALVLKLLLEAAAVSQRATTIWKDNKNLIPEKEKAIYLQYGQRALSNRLYYVADILLLGHEDKTYNRANLKEYVEDYISLDVPSYWQSFRADDNLMRAHQALGENAEALKVADRIFSKLRSIAEERAGVALNFNQIMSYLLDDEKPPMRSAMKQILGI